MFLKLTYTYLNIQLYHIINLYIQLINYKFDLYNYFKLFELFYYINYKNNITFSIFKLFLNIHKYS